MDGSSSQGIVKISGMMHLLDRNDYSQSIETLPKVLADVYNNFISMANVIEHAACKNEFILGTSDVINRLWEHNYLIGFVRSALKWCVSDGGVINRSLVDLLTLIEAHFMEVSQRHLRTAAAPPWEVIELIGNKDYDFKVLEQKILDAYLFIWKHCVPSASMFTEESVMERLDQAIEDDRMHKKQLITMKKFIHFIHKFADRASWEVILPRIDYVLDIMSCYFFHYLKGPSSDITNRLDAAIHHIVMQILVWHSESLPPFTGELLVSYVECIQGNLIWLLNEKYYYLAEEPKHQIRIIQDVLRLVLSLLSGTPKYVCGQEKQTLYTALRQLECIISSLFAPEFDGDKTSFQITDWLTRVFQALRLLLDSDGSLSNEIIIQFAYCFQHYRFLLPTDDGPDMQIPSSNQSKFDEDLVNMTRVVFYQWSEYHMEREILLNGRVEMVDVLRGMGSIICSSLNSEVEGNTRIDMNFGLPDLLSKFERVKQLIRMIFKGLRRHVHPPQTDISGFLSFFHENLDELRVYNPDLVKKDQLQTIQDYLVFFRSFLQKTRDKSIRCNSSQDLSIRIGNAVYDAEYMINAFSVGAIHVWCRSFILSDLIDQFNQIKEEVKTHEEIVSKSSSDVLPHEPVPTTKVEHVRRVSSQVSVPPIDLVVGFEDLKKQLMERLASGKKQLDVVSIVGMPGIGKTTLATIVYKDPYTINHFQLRAWCVVSHDYDKKNLLLSILGTDGNRQESFEELGVALHKKLMGRSRGVNEPSEPSIALIEPCSVDVHQCSCPSSSATSFKSSSSCSCSAHFQRLEMVREHSVRYVRLCSFVYTTSCSENCLKRFENRSILAYKFACVS